MKQKGFIPVIIGVILAIPLIVLSFFVIVYLFVARPVQIKGTAMDPNYLNGQYYFVTRLKNEPSRGDVVILIPPRNTNIELVKRVVALPGEKVMISDGKVYVNGNPLNESAYLGADIFTGPKSFLQDNDEVTVPAGQYFVLGDNRTKNSDSRDFGFVPLKNITGKVTVCYWNCSQ